MCRRHGFCRSYVGIRHHASLCYSSSIVGVTCFSECVCCFPVSGTSLLHTSLWLLYILGFLVLFCETFIPGHDRTTRTAVVSNSSRKMFQLSFPVSRPRSSITADLWSHPGESQLLPEEEESDGDMNIVGLGRSSRLGHTDEEPNLLGLHRSSQFGSFGEQNYNSQGNHSVSRRRNAERTWVQWASQLDWRRSTGHKVVNGNRERLQISSCHRNQRSMST